METYNALTEKHCSVCEGGVPALDPKEVSHLLKNLPGWESNPAGSHIQKTFVFKSFYKTMAFVNLVAYVANQQGHHPDLSVHYDRCVVTFTTHAINGLTENDFICASKIEKMLETAN